VTLGRKEREVREREDMILDVSRKMLAKTGFQGFRLDDLAHAIEYSKGTLYQHFSTKEDLMLAVCTKSLGMRSALFQRVKTFEGSSREKICALGLVDQYFVKHFPEYFDLDQMIKAMSFWDKTSQARRDEHIQVGTSCFQTMFSIVDDAKKNGDLPKNAKSNEIAFAIVSVTIGSHLTLRNPGMTLVAGIKPSFDVLQRHQHALLDGFGWKPLFSDWDWKKSYKRIVKDLDLKGIDA